MIKGIVINPTKIKVKGGIKAQKACRESFAEDLCEFLRDRKYEYIKTDDLKNFYSQRFPELNLDVKNTRPKFPLVGLAEQQYNKKTLELTDSDIKIASNTPIDKFLGLFGIKPHKDEFYVDGRFTEVVIHESIHSLQHFMKQTHSVYLKELDKIFGGNRENLVDMLNIRDNMYSKLVYNDSIFPIDSKTFRKNLVDNLNHTNLGNDRIALANLKSMIRDTENEKEAYEIGRKQLEYFRYPEMRTNKEYDKFAEKRAKDEIDTRFQFNEKLQIMKEEFFKLVEKIRKEQLIDKSN